MIKRLRNLKGKCNVKKRMCTFAGQSDLYSSVLTTTVTPNEYSSVKKYVFSQCNDQCNDKVTSSSGASNINLYDQSVTGVGEGGGGNDDRFNADNLDSTLTKFL